MNQYPSVTINDDILTDKTMSSDEKIMRALQKQYPHITYKDIANILNVSTRHLYNIRKNKKSEHAFRKQERAFLSEETSPTQIPNTNENAPSDSNLKNENAPSENENAPSDSNLKNENAPSENENAPSDSKEINPIPQDTKEKAYKKAIRILKGLKSEEDKEKNQKTINKIFSCTDLFTQEQFDEFDEILSELLQKYGD